MHQTAYRSSTTKSIGQTYNAGSAASIEKSLLYCTSSNRYDPIMRTKNNLCLTPIYFSCIIPLTEKLKGARGRSFALAFFVNFQLFEINTHYQLVFLNQPIISN